MKGRDEVARHVPFFHKFGSLVQKLLALLSATKHGASLTHVWTHNGMDCTKRQLTLINHQQLAPSQLLFGPYSALAKHLF